jgi:hypothetical protein
MEENRGRQAALCDCAEGSATDAHGRVWETWRSPAGERIRSFTIITTKPNKLCAELQAYRSLPDPALLPTANRGFPGHVFALLRHATQYIGQRGTARSVKEVDRLRAKTGRGRRTMAKSISKASRHAS